MNGVIFEALKLLGYTGTIDDMLLKWAQDNGATSNVNNEALNQVLAIQGGTGALNDKWASVLAGRGYTGSLQEKIIKFFSDGGTFGPPTPPLNGILLEDGISFLLAENNSFLTQE